MISGIDEIAKRMRLIKAEHKIAEGSRLWQNSFVGIGLAQPSEVSIYVNDSLVIAFEILVIFKVVEYRFSKAFLPLHHHH